MCRLLGLIHMRKSPAAQGAEGKHVRLDFCLQCTLASQQVLRTFAVRKRLKSRGVEMITFSHTLMTHPLPPGVCLHGKARSPEDPRNPQFAEQLYTDLVHECARACEGARGRHPSGGYYFQMAIRNGFVSEMAAAGVAGGAEDPLRTSKEQYRLRLHE